MSPNDSFLFQICTVLNVIVKLMASTFFEMLSTILYAGMQFVTPGTVFKCQVQFSVCSCNS